jgi:propanediol dehydratase small subunit
VQRSLSAAGLCHSSHCWWNAARAAELKDIDDNSMMGCIHIMIPYVSDVIRIVLELSTFQAAHPSKAVVDAGNIFRKPYQTSTH